MRKVTAGLFHSIDGVVEAPDRWQFDAFDDELGALLAGTIAEVDSVVLGRVGYEQWSAWWPNATADDDFAAFINQVPKYVAASRLQAPLAWTNAALIEGAAEDFVRELKQRPGRDIAVMGGIRIVGSLFLAGLIDELTLITHPVIAGTGRRLFETGAETARLALKRSERTSRGNVVSTYTLA